MCVCFFPLVLYSKEHMGQVDNGYWQYLTDMPYYFFRRLLSLLNCGHTFVVNILLCYLPCFLYRVDKKSVSNMIHVLEPDSFWLLVFYISIFFIFRPFDAKNPFLAPVKVNKELHKAGDRSCMHIEFDISGSKIR